MSLNPTPAYSLAARQPLALVVLLVALAAGVTIAIWLLPLGLLAYAAMVYVAAQDPALRSYSPPPPRVSRPKLTSPTFKAQVDAIERTQQEIGRSSAQAGGPLARLLTPISEQAHELVQEAYVLSGKGQTIERYLATVNPRTIQQEIANLDAQITATNDQYTREQLEETRRQRQEKFNNVRDLDTYIGRITAQLQNIGATLDNVLADTVRLRTADAASADATSNQVAQRLADLKSDMDAFQAVLDTAIGQAGKP
jgi:cell division septum initiation protein DivIVA